jgi:hypothetical protein
VELSIVKKLFRIISLLILTLSFSCEKQTLFVKCEECLTDEPDETDLTIKLDNYNYGVETIVHVYLGNIEDSILYNTIRTTNRETSIRLTINKKYTVTATYFISGKYYIAVDSANPGVNYVKDQCTDPCYYVYDRVVDLRLKYTK